MGLLGHFRKSHTRDYPEPWNRDSLEVPSNSQIRSSRRPQSRSPPPCRSVGIPRLKAGNPQTSWFCLRFDLSDNFEFSSCQKAVPSKGRDPPLWLRLLGPLPASAHGERRGQTAPEWAHTSRGVCGRQETLNPRKAGRAPGRLWYHHHPF